MNKRKPLRILFTVTLFLPPIYILISDYWPYLCRFTANLCADTQRVPNVSVPSVSDTVPNIIYAVPNVPNTVTNVPDAPTEEATTGHESLYGDSTCGDNPHRLTLHRLFSHWVNMSSQNNVTYFLTCGSLLGAWRNSDIIPYDRDVDVLVPNTSSVKLERLKDRRNFRRNDTKIRLVLQEDWRLPYVKRRRFMCYGKQVDRYRDHCSFQEPLARLVSGDHHLDI